MDLAAIFQQFVYGFQHPGALPELGRWTYVILAALVVVEGPIAILLASAAASTGLLKPEWVFVFSVAGNLTSDNLWYLLGYAGKMEWVRAVGRRLGFNERLLQHVENQLREHATRVMFLAKITISFSIPTLIAAGLIRIPWRQWFPYFVIAEVLWTGSLVLIGYYTTTALGRIEKGIEYGAIAAGGVFILVMIMVGRTVRRQLAADSGADPTGKNRN